ncbi:SnodProt1 [Crucibulum laeve]|uniref:SnodProt1 n=1 Tax=Crucibulum laeve TaxID=68775 RepID=A0A5C3M1K7_9AGAR|nr:SnodProt1 [Crucibulum laeve]
MKYFTTVATLVALPLGSFAVEATYDPVYDNRKGSMRSVACSDGSNGLIRHGYNTYGDLPTFPNIGGAQAVAGWNSPKCGSCWNITYTNPQDVTRSIVITAIDTASGGFNLATPAMRRLAGGETPGRIMVTSQEVDASLCGL